MFELIKRICQELDDKKIGYMLTGAVALNIYVIPRMSRDIDIVILLKKKEIELFLEIFYENFYFHKPTIIQEVENKGMFNVIDHITGYKIDFIIIKEDEFSIAAFRNKKYIKVDNFNGWVISIEDLIISKLKWIQVLTSEMHINDLKNLLANPEVDIQYIKDWSKQLKLKTFNLL